MLKELATASGLTSRGSVKLCEKFRDENEAPSEVFSSCLVHELPINTLCSKLCLSICSWHCKICFLRYTLAKLQCENLSNRFSFIFKEEIWLQICSPSYVGCVSFFGTKCKKLVLGVLQGISYSYTIILQFGSWVKYHLRALCAPPP